MNVTYIVVPKVVPTPDASIHSLSCYIHIIYSTPMLLVIIFLHLHRFPDQDPASSY